jgi:hypothetical protein
MAALSGEGAALALLHPREHGPYRRHARRGGVEAVSDLDHTTRHVELLRTGLPNTLITPL